MKPNTKKIIGILLALVMFLGTPGVLDAVSVIGYCSTPVNKTNRVFWNNFGLNLQIQRPLQTWKHYSAFYTNPPWGCISSGDACTVVHPFGRELHESNIARQELAPNSTTYYRYGNPGTSNVIAVRNDDFGCSRPAAPSITVTCAPDRSWLNVTWEFVPGQKLNVLRKRQSGGGWVQPDLINEWGPLPSQNHPITQPSQPGFQVNSYTDFNPPVSGIWQYQVKTDVAVAAAATGTIEELCNDYQPQQNNADWISHNVPTSGQTNQNLSLFTTFRNNGTTTWDPAQNYFVSIVAADDGLANTFGVPLRLSLPSIVAPGQTVTVYFNATLPSSPGTYVFPRFRMIEEGVGRFGERSPAVNITVTAPNQIPEGDHLGSSCTEVTGWAYDPDTVNTPINVHIYTDGPAGVGAFRGSITADDFNAAVPITDKNHGFSYTVPDALKDGTDHSIYVYAINSAPGLNPLIDNSPQTINCPPPTEPPTVENVNVVEPNYCTSGPAATVNWRYSGSSRQSAYQVIIRDGGVIVVDSGKVLSNSRSYFTGPGQLNFNETYNVEVIVWDSDDVQSGSSGLTSFSTPLHAYPQVDFSWDPQVITPGEAIGFLDETVYSAPPASWFWDFGDGNTSANQNPVHQYDDDGDKTVRFTVTDIDGFSCQQIQDLGVNAEPPRWIEVLPR